MESINNDGLQWNVVTSPLPDGGCGAACKYTVDVEIQCSNNCSQRLHKTQFNQSHGREVSSSGLGIYFSLIAMYSCLCQCFTLVQKRGYKHQSLSEQSQCRAKLKKIISADFNLVTNVTEAAVIMMLSRRLVPWWGLTFSLLVPALGTLAW